LIDSFDSSRGDYQSTKSQFGANVAVNGNARLQGQSQIDGTIFAPTPSTGTCVNGRPGISVSGNATVTGGYSNLPAVVPFTIPAGISAGSLNLNIHSSQLLTPGSYGDIAVLGSSTVTLSPGTYTINSLSLRQHAKVTVSPLGQVVIRLAGTGPGKPLDLSGGSVSGTFGASGSLLILYGGTKNLEIGGTSNSYGLLYAPNAKVNLSGTGVWFGAVVANTISDTNSSSIHYDRRLAP
jgi:hypothetical protein